MREHRLNIRVRFGETDKLGVVYHPNYLVYFELGRTEFLRAAGLLYSDLEERGLGLVVSEASVQYRSNASYDEPLVVRTTLGELGRARIRFCYLVENASGLLLAEGFTTIACINESSRPVRLPKEARSLIQAYLDSEPARS